jgi:hypothetical protein
MPKSFQNLGQKEIDTSNRIERQIRVIPPYASVDGDCPSHGVLDLDPSGFCIVNANTRTEIRVELLVSRCESQNEVPQGRASVGPGGHVPLLSAKNGRTIRARRERLMQREVSPASEAIIKEISLEGRTNPARAKDVTQFDAAKKTDVIFWVHLETVSEKRSVSSAVLIDVCPHVDAIVKIGAPIHRRRWRRDLFVFDSRIGSQRGCNSSE